MCVVLVIKNNGSLVLLLCVIWLIMLEFWAEQPFKAEKPARTRRFMASKAKQLQMHSPTHLPPIKGNHSTTQCKINRKQPTMGEKLETCLRFSRCLLWRWKWHVGGSAGGLDNLQTIPPTTHLRLSTRLHSQPSACLLIIRQRSKVKRGRIGR